MFVCVEGFTLSSFKEPKYFMCKDLGISLGTSKQERLEPSLEGSILGILIIETTCLYSYCVCGAWKSMVGIYASNILCTFEHANQDGDDDCEL